MADVELIILLVLLAIFSVVGTLGNALVIHVYRQRRDSLVSTVFILTLAVVDLSTCLVVIPYTIYMEAVQFSVSVDIVCKLYNFFITFNVPFSAFVMVAIAVDRYMCICHPFMHALNPYRAKISVGMIALFSAGLGVVTALFYGVYDYPAPITQPTNQTNLTNSSGMWFGNTSFDVSNYTMEPTTTEFLNISLETVTPTLDYENITDIIVNKSTPMLVNVGVCEVRFIYLGPTFLSIYHKIYMVVFFVDLAIVLILYILIYDSVVRRRTRRQRQKSASLALTSMQEDVTMATEETLCVNENGVHLDKSGKQYKEGEQPLKGPVLRPKTTKMMKLDRNAIANIRTAAMLFVVTVVYALTYLPSVLMGLQVVPFSRAIFYMYFANFIANPIIYAFMNKAFRGDLKRLLAC